MKGSDVLRSKTRRQMRQHLAWNEDTALVCPAFILAFILIYVKTKYIDKSEISIIINISTIERSFSYE